MFKLGFDKIYDKKLNPWKILPAEKEELLASDHAKWPFKDYVIYNKNRTILEDPKWEPNREMLLFNPDQEQSDIDVLCATFDYMRQEANKDEDSYLIFALNEGKFFPIRLEDYCFWDGSNFGYNPYNRYRMSRRNENIEKFKLSESTTIRRIYVSHYETLEEKQKQLIESLLVNDKEFQKERETMMVTRIQVSIFMSWPIVLQQLKNQQLGLFCHQINSRMAASSKNNSQVQSQNQEIQESPRLTTQHKQGDGNDHGEEDSKPAAVAMLRLSSNVQRRECSLKKKEVNRDVGERKPFSSLFSSPSSSKSKDSSSYRPSITSNKDDEEEEEVVDEESISSKRREDTGVFEDDINNMSSKDIILKNPEDDSMFGNDDFHFESSPEKCRDREEPVQQNQKDLSGVPTIVAVRAKQSKKPCNEAYRGPLYSSYLTDPESSQDPLSNEKNVREEDQTVKRSTECETESQQCAGSFSNPSSPSKLVRNSNDVNNASLVPRGIYPKRPKRN